MDDLSEALAKITDAVATLIEKIKKICEALNDLLIPYHRTMIVSYKRKGEIEDLIRRYSFMGRRLRVRERICNSSQTEGHWKLYFMMTNTQFKSLMTKIIVNKFDWKLSDYQQREVGKAFKHSKLGGGSGAKIYDIKKRRNGL